MTRSLPELITDAWQNTFSGIGGSRDKGRVDRIMFRGGRTLRRDELADAYRNNWLVRRYVQAMPTCALRRGLGFDLAQTPGFDMLNMSVHAEGALQRALDMARLMGGAGIYLGYADGGADLSRPAQQGAKLAFLEVFDAQQLMGSDRERDPASPEYDRPQIWTVSSGTRRTGLRFHTSRMLRFAGASRADDANIDQMTRDWDDSVLQCVWEDIQRYGVFWQSVSHLMQISSVGVLKLAGLIEMLASQNSAVAEARVDLISEGLSITRMLLLDAKHDESYERQAVSFTDVPALLDTLQSTLAGALDMPQSELFGRAPAGLNATGESDTRSWYDRVDAYRERFVEPMIYRLLALTDPGVSIDIEFKPLWEPSEQEAATTRLTVVQKDERLWSMGVASDAELRRAYHEDVPVETLLTGLLTSEPARAVTMIQAIKPEQNPAAVQDPKAADDPSSKNPL